MSEGKHTPGPWFLEVDKSKDPYMRGEWVIRSPSDNSLMGNADYYPWQSGNIYDAHLIAAAPDMLEALELVAKHADQNLCSPYIAKVCAAISKAKGINPDE